MKVAILLKSGPCTVEASRALQTAEDMLSQGHLTSLYLLQEAVRFCGPGSKCLEFDTFGQLIKKGLEVHVLAKDAKLRGLSEPFAVQGVVEGSYESLVDLMESCDRVVGIL